MVKMGTVPFAVVDFMLVAGPLTGVTKNVTLTATSSALTSPYDWVWEMYLPGNTSGTPDATQIGGNTVTFPGLGQSPTDYIFKLKAKSDCEQLGGSLQGWHFQTRAKAGKTVTDPNPEPVDFKALRAKKNQKGPQPTGKRNE